MDLEMFMNLFIYILALFGVILLLFLFVKFVLWCLMCDTDPLYDGKKIKLEFQLDRIERSKANKRNKKSVPVPSTYRKALEPLPEARELRRSPEIERLNSENLLLNSALEDKICGKYSDTDSSNSEDEILIVQELEKVIRDAESPPVQYAEIDHERKVNKRVCLERNESTLSCCVCPYCSRSGQAKSVPNTKDVAVLETTEHDHVSIKIEDEDHQVIDVEKEIKIEVRTEESQNVKRAFAELDNALEEIDGFVVELINENLDDSQAKIENCNNVQKEEDHEKNIPEIVVLPESESETEQEEEQEEKQEAQSKQEAGQQEDNNNNHDDSVEKKIKNDRQAVDVESVEKQQADQPITPAADGEEEGKPKPPEKPKTFIIKTASKSQPQCVPYSQVVKQLKQRNLERLNSNEANVPS